MDYKFENCISGIIETATPVEIEETFIRRISVFVSELIQKKAGEQHHVVDNRKESKRFITGFMGEAALEKVLGIPIINWSIGSSNAYHVPDIPGYKVGIKTVEYGKFPIIFKHNDYPQIICIVAIDEPRMVYVCGIAPPEILNKYQDDNLVLDSKLRARGTKTGFYGFDHLKPITGVVDIEPYKMPSGQHLIKYAGEISDLQREKKICPECKREMKMRTGKFGQFWGCTGFPRCTHTENV